MVVEHKHKIGFKGTILIEPKPFEPTKHQYDRDVSTVYGFLQKNGLRRKSKVNIESQPRHAGRPRLRARSWPCRLRSGSWVRSTSIAATRAWLGHRPVPQQRPGSARAFLSISRTAASAPAAATSTPSCAVSRSTDLFHAHVGAIDVTARALLIVEQMLKDGKLAQAVQARYEGWTSPLGKEILAGKATFDSLSKHVLERNQDVAAVSGRQEALENLINRYL
jgi:xylose isomerase